MFNDIKAEIQKNLTLNNFLKGLYLIVFIILIQFLFNKWLVKSDHQNKFATIDLLKIQQDYMGKAIGLVTQINANQGLSDQQKFAKAQNVLKVVGDNVQSLSDNYSKQNSVIVFQKQAIMSDSGMSLPDITSIIESQIDNVINKQDLDNAAR